MATCVRRAVAAVIAALSVSLSTVSATTVLPVDFDEMVTRSHTVVRGRVVDVRTQATAGRRSIESLVTLEVVDAVKGSALPEVVFRVPGGQVGRYRRVMAGAPEFAPGDDVVVFLSGTFPVIPMPFGLSQGVYRIQRGPGGRAVVNGPQPGQQGLVRGDPARRPVEVELFLRQVRAIAGRQP
jgi:hypothetical protein